MSFIVHKFGGSSVADEAGYRRVADIVRDAAGDRRSAVVVSAMGGATDALLGLVDRAGQRAFDYTESLAALRRRHTETAAALLPETARARVQERFDADFRDLEDILRAIWLMGSGPANARDLVSGYGELWSAQLLVALLASDGVDAGWIDSRDVLVVVPTERDTAADTTPDVLWDASREKLDAALADRSETVLVLPGYVARDPAGIATTLGRNGSDYSASIFGSLLDAESITIWTDVDGVLSADPRYVADALVLERLSYDEAMELAYFGAKVLHPSTMSPAVAKSIPIFIRNSFNAKAPGTRIDAVSDGKHPVKGLATVTGMALVNLEGTGMIGVPGIARRLFGALAEAGVSVVLISQGSSEHSICCAIPAEQSNTARDTIERAFFAERHYGQIQTLEIQQDCAILAAVGDTMAGTPGVAAKLFGALGRAGANVRAIAQGSSERNISVVLDAADATRALRAVHAGFYLSNQTLSVGLIGPGIVGATLLDQLAGQAERLRNDFRIDLRVRGIAASRRMLLTEDNLLDDAGGWRERWAGDAAKADLDRFADHVQTDQLPHTVLVDCTASANVAARYGAWVARGIHVVTPNKMAGSAPMADWRALRAACDAHRRHWLYEATVGAGLPIVQTLRDLLQTGDEVLRIEGVLSGTLSYLFNAFDGERPFSAIVREARDKGYTEPDPREDLSGMDVARKVVILAREMGLALDVADLEVASLVPAGLECDSESDSPDDFLDRLAEHDDAMRQRFLEAVEADEVLRFVGVVDPGGASCVELRRYPRTHPFAGIDLTDNIVQFTTKRYSDNPLVVRGPGAGPEVTAGGVFADLLRLAAWVG